MMLKKFVKYKEFWQNLHRKSHVKEVGCSYLPSFISVHTITTSKTSLVKQYCVPTSELGAGGQNCSLAPDSVQSGSGLNELINNV